MSDTIDPRGLSAERAANSALQLIDVREQFEWDIARIDGSTLIPLSQLPSRIGELDQQSDIVTICHSGVRSMHALHYLRSAGFSRVRSLAGGIDAWAAEIDPSVPRY